VSVRKNKNLIAVLNTIAALNITAVLNTTVALNITAVPSTVAAVRKNNGSLAHSGCKKTLIAIIVSRID